MSIPATMLDYAPPALELPADRLLRRIVAWLAIVYGGLGIISAVVRTALALQWAASPPTMAWGFHGATDWITSGLGALFMVGMLIGGLMLLRRSSAGIVILRATIACSIALSISDLVWLLSTMPILADYWSKPATATIEFLNYFSGLWVPILLGFLTLPSLARRMV